MLLSVGAQVEKEMGTWRIAFAVRSVVQLTIDYDPGRLVLLPPHLLLRGHLWVSRFTRFTLTRFSLADTVVWLSRFELGGNFALPGVPSVGASGGIFAVNAVQLVDLLEHWQVSLICLFRTGSLSSVALTVIGPLLARRHQFEQRPKLKLGLLILELLLMSEARRAVSLLSLHTG